VNILGISAFYHDAAACLVIDGDVKSAAQQERFSRRKHDPRFPTDAAKYCIESNGIKFSDLDYVAFYDKPFLKFDRLLETYMAFAPRGFVNFSTSLPFWLKDKLFQKRKIVESLQGLCSETDWEKKVIFSEHHLSHAASAFYPSPFESAAILTMDGVGEWATTAYGIGNCQNLELISEIHFPHSLGLLYSAFTSYTGFKVNSGEYKVMGLAPYGSPKYAKRIKEHLIDIKEDGSFRLNMQFFDFCTGKTMTNERFHKLFEGDPRKLESEITQREMDLAASIQVVLDEVVIKLSKNISNISGQKNLCLAGGVALNCVTNGKLHREELFDEIWVQPAAGDAGGCIGAALSAYYLLLGNSRETVHANQDGMKGAYLGPEYSESEIESVLLQLGANFSRHAEDEIIEITAQAIASGKAVGWFQDRMEFGPRSLGARSIIADPRDRDMQKNLNLKIKYRESFRPFAPSVLRENLEEWFEFDKDSPYMLQVANVKSDKLLMHLKDGGGGESFGIAKLNLQRSQIPAVTHVDNSARIQTVHKETNLKFHKLISKFKEITDCPILVNTSFNVRGEPIVCSPVDAFKCFMGTELDLLVIENFVVDKKNQDPNLQVNYLSQHELD
jgi:carbamoyltransferase